MELATNSGAVRVCVCVCVCAPGLGCRIGPVFFCWVCELV